MNDEDRLSLHPGSVIAGAYVVDRVLGVGGMGTVVAARTIATGEVVAIKFMLPHFAAHQQLLVRFQREARATERVQSRHVRRVIFAGAASARMPYIVMEYLDGEDLRSLVRREGPLEPRQAAAYVSQACIGLAEAHALGIVHRDLKPANLFLARRPDGPSIIKVLDFGVAKFDSPNVSGDTMEVTEIEAMVGSRLYMAPEQMTKAQSVNALADVWALGAILHYLLSGATPFGAATTEEVIVNVLREPPHSLAMLRPDVPAGLVKVVKRCLEKKPSSRYSNVTELLRALVPFMRAQDEEAVPSARYPKEFSRTLRLINFPKPHTVAEQTSEPITTPMTPIRAAAAPVKDTEPEIEPGDDSVIAIDAESMRSPTMAITLLDTEPPPPLTPDRLFSSSATTRPPPPMESAPDPSNMVTEEPSPRLSKAPALPFARPARHPRGVVIGWIASAIVGGLIAVAVGRPPSVQATTAIAPPAAAPERATTPTALVVAAAPTQKETEDAGLTLNPAELPDLKPAQVKSAPSTIAAPKPAGARVPTPILDSTAIAASDFPREPLFVMPAPRERQAATPGADERTSPPRP
ncbi:MAG: protein kinase [Byssovorax sp.]